MPTKGQTSSEGTNRSDPDTAADMLEKLKDTPYEQAIEELESIIDQVERGEVGLEESLKAQRRGDALIRHCRSILDRAEQQIEHLSSDADTA